MASPLEESGLKEARDEENNIIISDSTLRNILPTQQNKSPLDTKLCMGVIVTVAKKMHSSLLSWREHFLKNLNIKAVMHKTEGLVKSLISLFETYKNSIMPHGEHMF